MRRKYSISILVFSLVWDLLNEFLLSFKGDLSIENDIQLEKYAPKARSANQKEFSIKYNKKVFQKIVFLAELDILNADFYHMALVQALL